jgi:hypothetical protein
MKLGRKKAPIAKPADKLYYPQGQSSSYHIPAKRFQCPVLSCDTMWIQIQAGQPIPSCKEHGRQLVATGMTDEPPRPVVK